MTYLNKYINIFNNNFSSFLIIILLFLVAIAMNLYSDKKEEGMKWIYFKIVIIKKLMEISVFFFCCIFIVFFLNEVFSIKILESNYFSQYWKVVLSFFILCNISQGKKIYDEINFKDLLKEIADDKYLYSSPENIMLEMIERYHLNYSLEVERLGILKSLTPISLVPLLAGYIFEGKNIQVNWNGYTITFFVFLCFYFYKLWKCYNNIKLWKTREFNVQNALREMHGKKEIDVVKARHKLL